MEERPPDPGGTVPPGSVNAPSKMDILIAAVESSMDTDASIVSNSDQKLKRKIFSRVCTTCNKRKRKTKTSDGKERYIDCACESNKKTQYPPNPNLTVPSPNPNSKVSADPISSTNTNSSSQPTRVPIGRATYQKSDNGPYVVHIQKEIEANDSPTVLHPISFGRFLKNNEINGVVNGSLKRIGRNRISMAFSSYIDANKFISNKSLELANYRTFIPSFNVTRMGVIKGIPNDWTEDDILTNISVPPGCGPIIKVRRIKRKVTVNNVNDFINTGTVIVTFDGQVLPNRVYMCFTVLSVDLYIYPTIQCYQCCRFGHVKNQCRSTPRCYKCGQGHSGDSCQIEEEEYRCCLCKGLHQAINKKCLEYNRQKTIKDTMSKCAISYMEASKMHPPIAKISYAEAMLSTPMSSSSHNIHGSTTSNFPTTTNSVPRSYKKTVFVKPKIPSKTSGGYDRASHYDIIRDPVLPNLKPNYNNDNSDENSMKIADIIKLLIQLLSQSNIFTPSHVATVTEALNQISYHNGSQSQSNPVELPEPQQ